MDDKKISELIDAMEQSGIHQYEFYYYLNKSTHELLFFSDETKRLYENYDEEELNNRNLPDWQKEDLKKFDEVYESEDYALVGEIMSWQSYNIMENFVSEKIENENIQERFYIALDGRGAFGRFFNLIRKYPEINYHWEKYAFQEKKKLVIEWAESRNINL